MKMVIATLVLAASSAFASGPTYYETEMEIAGQSTQKNEVLACADAKDQAFKNIDWGSLENVRAQCNPEDVKKSSCACEATKDNAMTCEYKAVTICVEEVWYP